MAGNSWQQPVSGEPSWGSMHPHLETIVDTYDPTTTNDITVTCTNVPTGTKAIFGWFRFYSTNARYLSIKDASANTWSKGQNIAANNAYGYFCVPLDSGKQFKYAVNNTDVSVVDIIMCGYFI